MTDDRTQTAGQQDQPLFSKTPEDVVWIITPRSWSFIYCSPTVLQMLGYFPSELKHLSLKDILIDESINFLTDILPASIATLESAELPAQSTAHEAFLRHKNGFSVAVDMVVTLIKNESGKVDKLSILCRKKPERKMSDHAFRESERRNRILLDAIPDLLFLVSRGGVFIDYKAKSGDTLYVAPDFFLWKNITEVLPAEVAALILSEIELAFTTNKLQTFDYHLIINNTIMFFEARAVADIESNEAFVIVRDVTEKTLHDVEIKKEHDFAIDILESMADAFIALDKEYRCVYMNYKAGIIFTLTTKESSGKNLWADFPESKTFPFQSTYKRIIQCNEAFSIEEYCSQQAIWYENSVNYTENGVFIFSRDITGRKNNESSIELEKARLRNLIDSIPDMIWLEDTRGEFLACNGVFAESLGKSEAEIIGKTISDFRRGKPGDIAHTKDQSAITSNEPIIFIEEIVFANGYRGTFQTIKKPMYDLQNNLIGILGIARDITNLRKSEENLSRLSVAIMQTADTVFITDKNGNIEYVNDSLLQIYGYKREELIGKNPRIFKSGIKDNEFYEGLWKTILAGEPFRAEVINKSKDGIYIYEDRNITPLKDSNGTVTHFLSVGRDITERKQAELQIAKNERRFSTIIQTAFDGFLIIGTQGTIIEANHAYCKMSGYTRDEILKLKLMDLTAEEEEGAVSRRVEIIKRDGRAEFESTHRRKDGSVYPVEVRVMMSDFNGPAMISFLKDITEQKKLIADLKYEKENAVFANRLKSRYFADMSQGLRRPVASIINEIESIKNELRPTEVRSSLGTMTAICGQVNRTLDLIQNLSHIDEGHLKSTIQEVNAVRIVKDCIENIDAQTPQKKSRILYDTANEYYQVSTDRTIFTFIIDNLLDSMISYPRTREIFVSLSAVVREKSEFCRIEFRIVREQRQDNVASGEIGGTGKDMANEPIELNFPVASKIIELLGGVASSEDIDDQNTLFTMYLPQKRQE